MSLQLLSLIVAGMVLTDAAAFAKRIALTVLALLALALLVWRSGVAADVPWPVAGP